MTMAGLHLAYMPNAYMHTRLPVPHGSLMKMLIDGMPQVYKHLLLADAEAGQREDKACQTGPTLHEHASISCQTEARLNAISQGCQAEAVEQAVTVNCRSCQTDAEEPTSSSAKLPRAQQQQLYQVPGPIDAFDQISELEIDLSSPAKLTSIQTMAHTLSAALQGASNPGSTSSVTGMLDSDPQETVEEPLADQSADSSLCQDTMMQPRNSPPQPDCTLTSKAAETLPFTQSTRLAATDRSTEAASVLKSQPAIASPAAKPIAALTGILKTSGAYKTRAPEEQAPLKRHISFMIPVAAMPCTAHTAKGPIRQDWQKISYPQQACAPTTPHTEIQELTTSVLQSHGDATRMAVITAPENAIASAGPHQAPAVSPERAHRKEVQLSAAATRAPACQHSAQVAAAGTAASAQTTPLAPNISRDQSAGHQGAGKEASTEKENDIPQSAAPASTQLPVSALAKSSLDSAQGMQLLQGRQQLHAAKGWCSVP